MDHDRAWEVANPVSPTNENEGVRSLGSGYFFFWVEEGLKPDQKFASWFLYFILFSEHIDKIYVFSFEILQLEFVKAKLNQLYGNCIRNRFYGIIHIISLMTEKGE